MSNIQRTSNTVGQEFRIAVGNTCGNRYFCTGSIFVITTIQYTSLLHRRTPSMKVTSGHSIDFWSTTDVWPITGHVFFTCQIHRWKYLVDIQIQTIRILHCECVTKEMACAKFCSDHFLEIWMITKRNFYLSISDEKLPVDLDGGSYVLFFSLTPGSAAIFRENVRSFWRMLDQQKYPKSLLTTEKYKQYHIPHLSKFWSRVFTLGIKRYSYYDETAT